MRLAAVLCLALALACANDTITRDEWQQMSPDKRLLYVQSLLGAEQAKAAKGGPPSRYTRPAAEYVQAIDRAYANGDQRPAHEIFARN